MRSPTLTQSPQASDDSIAASGVARRAALAGVTLAGIAFLSGCLVPEKFAAKVEVKPDTAYTFHYSGTAVHAMAAAQIKQAGSLSPKDEAALRAEVEKMTKDRDVRNVAYKGSGRYDLEIESHKKPGQLLQMFDIFTIRTDKDGTMTISSNEIKEKGKRELQTLGLVIDGTLEVRIPKNAEVIANNATSTPTFGFGTYSWKIGRVDQKPLLQLRFKQ